jgi:integrase
MASITLKPTSRYWYACFRDRNGKQHRISTHETRKSVAQKIAERYELAATRNTSRKALWETLNELQQLVGGDSTPSVSVTEFLDLWLANKKAEGVSEATYLIYQKTANRLLEFLGANRRAHSLLTISKQDIERFRNRLVEEGLSPATVNKALRISRMLFRTARLDGYIFDDPTEGVRSVKGEPSRARRPFTLKEIQSVVEIASPEWQSLIKLGLYTGQRLGDLAGLRWENVDLESGRLHLVTRKTGTQIKLPLAGPLRDHLLSLSSSDDPRQPLHPRAYEILSSQDGRTNVLSAEFITLLVEAGLRPPITHTRTGRGHFGPRRPSELSFHSLRHMAVSLLKAAGVPHAIAQALIGHESEAISANYTHVGDQALGEALEKLPSL